MAAMCPVQHFKEMRPSCQGCSWCTDISFLCGKRWEQQARHTILQQASTTSSNSKYKSWYCMSSPMGPSCNHPTQKPISSLQWHRRCLVMRQIKLLRIFHYRAWGSKITIGPWRLSYNRSLVQMAYLNIKMGHLPIVTHDLWHDL